LTPTPCSLYRLYWLAVQLATRRLETLRAHLSGGAGAAREASGAGAVECGATAGYKYTRDADGYVSCLTKEQRDFYEENGYLVVRGLVSQAELDRYFVRFQSLCDGTKEKAPMLTLMRDGALAAVRSVLVRRALCAAAALPPRLFVERAVLTCPRSRMCRRAAAVLSTCAPVTLVKGKTTGVGDGVRGEGNITKAQNFEDDDVLFEYCKNPDVLRYVREFTGNDIKSVHTSTWRR
jgi:hypothetical protein